MPAELLGLAFLPDVTLASRAIELAARLGARYSFSYLLDGRINLPHVTLVQATFNGMDTARRIAGSLPTTLPTLRPAGFALFRETFLFVQIEPVDALLEYHLRAVDLTEAAGARLFDPDIVRHGYQPHLTLGRSMGPPIDLEWVHEQDIAVGSMGREGRPAGRLVVCAVGTDGACSEVRWSG